MWVWFYLPELKGRTLEEIDEMVCPPPPLPLGYYFCPCLGGRDSVLMSVVQFLAKLPARKFRTYKCVGNQAVGGSEKSVDEVEVQSVKADEKA